MKAIPKRLPSPAMIVACASLVVALGGVTYAAGVLPRNSVGAAQLQKNAITTAKLRKSAVTGATVKNGTLMAADFKAGQLLAGPQGPKGDPGAPGPVGAKGDAGATGSPGLSNIEVVEAKSANDFTSPKNIYPSCPGDKRAIAAGGSASTQQADEGKVILTHAFVVGSNAARVTAVKVAGTSPSIWQLTGYVTCANVG